MLRMALRLALTVVVDPSGHVMSVAGRGCSADPLLLLLPSPAISSTPPKPSPPANTAEALPPLPRRLVALRRVKRSPAPSRRRRFAGDT